MQPNGLHENRSVGYRSADETSSYFRLEGWPSDQLPLIRNRELRLALELADIAQALEFPYPQYGGFQGNVKVIGETVLTDFPDDTYERMKRYLNENH